MIIAILMLIILLIVLVPLVITMTLVVTMIIAMVVAIVTMLAVVLLLLKKVEKIVAHYCPSLPQDTKMPRGILLSHEAIARCLLGPTAPSD